MTDKFYGNGYVDRGDQEKYLKHNTLIYNLYRALYEVDKEYGISQAGLLKQAHKYLEERNLLDQNEED